MRFFHDLSFRFKALFRPGSMEHELDDEMAFHLDMEARKLEQEGLAPTAARQEAHRRFGGSVRQKERVREAWGIGVIGDLFADVRHAFRQFKRQPGFTAVAVLTLALGLGATVALYSVVNGLMLRPLPVTDEDRVQVFWSDYNWRGVEFDYVAERPGAFDGLAAFSTDAVLLHAEAGTSLIETVVGSAELFDVLGTAPLMGRTFAAGEDRPGAEPVAVISYGLWQQELGGDPNVVGSRLQLGGIPTTVIGVMPRSFYFPTPEFRLWRPLDLDPTSSNYANNGWLVLVGRIGATSTPVAVEQSVQDIAAALGERFTYPEAWDKTKGAHVTPLREYLLGNVEPAVLLVLGAVTILLLMACTNTAALLIARTSDRTQEMAVRAALGAGRGRVARQVLTESLTLSLLSGVTGAAVAAIMFRSLVARLPLQGGFGETLSLDWTTFAVSLGLALIVGCVVSVFPIRRLLVSHLEGAVGGERTETGRAGAHRAHNTLVALEVMLAVVLVVGASLLIRSVERISALDPGFEPEGVVAMGLMVSPDELSDPERAEFFRAVLERVESIPGVASAGYTNRLPIRDGGWQGPITIESRDDLQGAKRPNSLFRWATPGFFETMGIEIQQGRGIEPSDREDTPPVVVVSESFARRMWPGQDPVGQRMRSGFLGGSNWATVVGVIEETRMIRMVGENPMVYYIPLTQAGVRGANQRLVFRSSLDPAPLIMAIRGVVNEVDSRAAISQVTTMNGVVARALAEPLRLRFFLSLFAGLALVLGMVGVYGVVSYAVARRRAEFGIRMAMGAAPRQVMREVVRRGVIPVSVGVVVGLVITAALSSVVGAFLYEIAPTDPVSLGVSGLTLLVVGVAAAMIPAWRAGRVSPVEVLRAE
jgi:predicted permease